MRVIYIDDDADDRFLFQSSWKDRPGACDLVQEPSAADLAARLTSAGALEDPAWRPALILLDLNLPVLDGFQFLQWLRARPGGTEIPVVAFSSSSNPADIRRAYALGANGYVVKPDSLDGLAEVVDALIRFWVQVNRSP
jgi:CheY-like chemotaxis protein